MLSQLKQDPLTRHIPVQIVTLDEDRQHGLARGAFSFVTKPTHHRRRSKPRLRGSRSTRRRAASGCWSSRTTPAEQLSIAELLGHDDIDIVTAGTGAEALAALREQPCDCVVLDLRLPDMSGFEVLEQIRDDEALARRAGRRLHRHASCPPTKMRSCTRWRAASWSRASSRPSGCSTRPRCSCTASSTDLPAEKQRMLERLHSSDEDLVGRTVLVVDDDVRNIFALEQRARAARHEGAHRHAPGSEAIELLETTPDVAIVLMDIMMPEMDGYQTMQRDPREAGVPPPADHRADREGDEGRPREVPRGRRLRLPRQAGQHRAAAVALRMWLHR